jgi:hypothetical protein
MKDKGSLPLESYALDHALLLWVRKLICFPILVCPEPVLANRRCPHAAALGEETAVVFPRVCPEPVLGKHDRFHSTQNTALFSSLLSSCIIIIIYIYIYIYIYIITRRVTSMRRRSASNGACSGQYGCKTAETSVSGSARKSQTRLRDTPRFKFQAVLARAQPFLSRSVEKRGDQSRFKSLGLYINVILVAGVGTFRHTSAVLMASRHALSPRCETKTMFSVPIYILNC